jgi:hypothetical protein
MKKSIIPVLLMSFALQSQAQDRENFFRFGIKAGVNINKIDGKSFKDEFAFNYQLGGFAQINFSKRWGIQPEINIAQASADQSEDITEIYDDLFLGGDQARARLNLLKVAGLVNYNVGPSKRVKLQFGPQWSINLDEDVDNMQSSQEVFKKSEFSVLGGLMLQLPLVHVGGRYELGLTNINDIDNQDEWKRQAWQIFVGFTF